MPTDSTDASVIRAVERRRGDRRERRSGVHSPERRLGFDNRADRSASPRRLAYRAWVRRISESPARAAILMATIVALGIADIAFTFAALDRGLEELNPVMVWLLDSGHGVAAVVKVGVTAVLAAAGWWFRRFRRVIEGAIFVAALMSLLVVYHLVGLIGA